ncbi:MAG: long-chain fatty acid--CoA ligase [Myxococcota bacterium]|nr:long-chain fatty acid--CoA ligase [Myxococcota bacterium]
MLRVGRHVPVKHLAADAHSLPDLFARRVEYSGTKVAHFHKALDRWHPVTWKQWSIEAHRVAHGLVHLGIEDGDRVAILGPTQSPWAVYDIATQLAGGISLGIYPKQSVAQVRYILQHSGAKVVFVADRHEMVTVLEACKELTSVVAIIPWREEEATGFVDDRLASPTWYQSAPDASEQIAERSANKRREDTAIFVYTSGTTGPPKCAMITHGNILSVLACQVDFVDFFEDDIALSFLPMAHCAERVLSFYGRIAVGTATAYASSVSAVLNELQEVKPTLFGSVPRIFEKAYGRIYAELEKKSPTVRALFEWSLSVGLARLPFILDQRPVPIGLRLKYAIADRIVFRKIRAAFGGRVRQFLTGAAPTPLPILEFFWAAGLPIYELYGQTEATVVTHANVPAGTRLGTVGRLVGPLEHRIAADGEVLIRGPFVFKGYFKDPVATAETIVDGWLHTGDIGQIDGDGYLRITDRKKHIIITAGGKNLTPANIEKVVKGIEPLMSHVHAHADKRPYVVALIAPSPIETMEFGVARGLVTKAELEARTAELMNDPSSRSQALANTMKPVTEHPEFRDRIRTAVQRANENLSQVERIKRVVILDRDFSQEAGEMTPTMKVKRKAVERLHAQTFDQIYANEGATISIPG